MTTSPEPPPEVSLTGPVTTEWADDVVILRVSGDVDYVTAPQVQEAVQTAFARQPKAMVLDLLRVSFFGSAGLSLLVQATYGVKPETQLRITAGPAILRPMRLAGLVDHLERYLAADNQSQDV
jgi:anti-sigma B factor antagonist